MGHRYYKWETKELKGRFKFVWKEYLDEYFEGNLQNWLSRGEPYIFYKHIFRKFVWQKFDVKAAVREIENFCTGNKPCYSTIYSSIGMDVNQFKLTNKQLTEIIKFLNKRYEVSSSRKLKGLIYKWQDKGYTISDIARHCVVREETIDHILHGTQVPYYLEQQIEKELT